MFKKIRQLFIGKERDPLDPDTFHKLSLVAFFAWVGLGSDGLSSSCYGPSEVMMALGNNMHLSLFVAIGTVITIIIISSSYQQIIELFPSGGGGYQVASKLLSPKTGMISGSALVIDYILTISVSISSGSDALFSFLPGNMLQYKLIFALVMVCLLTILNMRGVKESVLPLVPIFLIFIFTHLFAILYAFFTHVDSMPTVISDTAREYSNTIQNVGIFGTLFIIMHAYSMGAGTYTGIEAVSNGLPILREPKVLTAKKTMKYMAISLSLTVLGLMVAYLFYKVQFQEGKTLNAVLFESLASGWSPGIGHTFVIITLLSEAVILLVAAQTGFLDGPRVLANMALDRWVPTRFAALSDRLVTQNGILLMGIASFFLILFSEGSVTLMLVLYSINVFITFSLSQLGMVRHWWLVRHEEKKWKKKLAINGIGLMMTTFILIMVIIVKFDEGGWITVFITGSLVVLLLFVKRHYNNVAKLIKRVDSLVYALESEEVKLLPKKQAPKEFNPHEKTAVLLVNGFTGLGLHSLFGIFRLFGETFKNFVLLQIGVIDAGVFKGVKEIEELEEKMNKDLNRYIDILNDNGYYAVSYTKTGLDVVDAMDKTLPDIIAKYPNAVFFGGQLVFKNETFFSRWLHNHTVFSIQRKLYHQGVQFVIMPIKV